MEAKERQFYARLMSSYDQVLSYENQHLQDLYISHVPLDELQKRAEELQQTKLDKEKKEMSSLDCLLLVLLKWFKSEFFRGWARMSKCEPCGTDGVPKGKGVPTAEELRWEAYNIELYQCPKCNRMLRFPRYNHPQKLLETRTGRCGEWANAFTMFCVALGFNTRYIVDWTDHVWTEVFSDSQQKWLHCDPCEGICDRPLLYEAGWKKKLTYVIAFSKNQIMDVTWRYSNKHNDVLQRRNECRENWLVLTLSAFNKNLMKQLPSEDRKRMEVQGIRELVSFLTVCDDIKDEEKQGRSSGSVEWRQQRGELGATPQHQASSSTYTFKPNEEDVKARRLRIRYCTATDVYHRGLADDVTGTIDDVQGWQNGVHSMEAMCRKTEDDWQMVYLARQEGSNVGRICWMIDFRGSQVKPESINIRASFSTFENGEVKMRLAEDTNNGLSYSLDGGAEAKTFQLSGFPVLRLTAELQSTTANDGANHWQHSQLFRQPLTSIHEHLLDITITLKSKQ